VVRRWSNVTSPSYHFGNASSGALCFGSLRRYDSRMGKRKISAETKLALLRRHLLDHEPAFRLAQEAGVDRSTLHRWQQRFLRYSFQYGQYAFAKRSTTDRNDPTYELNMLLEKLSMMV
jgi:transposase-like protein